MMSSLFLKVKNSQTIWISYLRVTLNISFTSMHAYNRWKYYIIFHKNSNIHLTKIKQIIQYLIQGNFVYINTKVGWLSDGTRKKTHNSTYFNLVMEQVQRTKHCDQRSIVLNINKYIQTYSIIS